MFSSAARRESRTAARPAVRCLIASENDFWTQLSRSEKERERERETARCGEHVISRDRARRPAHQYPVNILGAPAFRFAVAACKHNILSTKGPIPSSPDVKEPK